MPKKPSNLSTPPPEALEEALPKKKLRFSNEELKHLLVRCLHNDEKAWEEVFSSLYGLVKDVVLQVGLRDEDVEDAVGESFFRMFAFIEDVAASRKPLPYIGALAHYTALAFQEAKDKQSFHDAVSSDSEPAGLLASLQRGDTPKQGVTIMATQVHEGIMEALKQLRPAERHLIRLKYVQDLCYDEIAYIIGKDVGATRVATFRAVRKLKQLVRPEIRDMVTDTYELWNRIAALKIQDGPAPPEDRRIQILLEDYVAGGDSMPPEDRAEIEALLAKSFRLRERKVTLERDSLVKDEDVTGHALPEAIPPALLQRLMDRVRSQLR